MTSYLTSGDIDPSGRPDFLAAVRRAAMPDLTETMAAVRRAAMPDLTETMAAVRRAAMPDLTETMAAVRRAAMPRVALAPTVPNLAPMLTGVDWSQWVVPPSVRASAPTSASSSRDTVDRATSVDSDQRPAASSVDDVTWPTTEDPTPDALAEAAMTEFQRDVERAAHVEGAESVEDVMAEIETLGIQKVLPAGDGQDQDASSVGPNLAQWAAGLQVQDEGLISSASMTDGVRISRDNLAGHIRKVASGLYAQAVRLGAAGIGALHGGVGAAVANRYVQLIALTLSVVSALVTLSAIL
jgi:hypothetical protein